MEKINIQQVKKELSLVEKNIQKFQVKKIQNENELEKISRFLLDIRNYKLKIQEKKNSILKPLNEAVKNIRSLFAPVEKNLEDAEFSIKKEIEKYHLEKEAKAEKEKQKIAEKVEIGKISFEKAIEKIEKIEEATKNIQSENGMINFRTVKRIAIENPELLPREYLIPDEVKIRRDVLAGKEIPGVKIYEEKVSVVKVI
jgi:hypothetical protein